MTVQTQAQLKELFAFIDANERLAYDIETTGLNVRKDRIIGFSIANSTRGYYIPFLRWDTATSSLVPAGLDKSDIQAVLHYLSDKKLITFNGAFDLPFTSNFFGVNLLPTLYCDVMLKAHTADENRRSYALKEIATDYFGDQVTVEQADMFASIKANGGSAKEYFKSDLEPMAKYAIQDAVLTARLDEALEPQLAEDGLLDFFYTVEVMPLYREVTIPMEQHGLRLDVPFMQSTLQEITQDISVLESRIQAAISPNLGLFEQWFLRKDYPYVYSGAFAQQAIRYFGGNLPLTANGAYSVAAGNIEKMPDSLLKRWLLRLEDLPETDIVAIQRALWQSENSTYMFNLNSRHHLKKLFFDTLGEKSINYTPTGQNQANEQFIETMVPKYAWAADLMTYYKLMKLKGTYIERFLDDAEDSRFYPRYFQHRTVSGRLSGDFQQLPRPIDGAPESDLVAKYTNRIRAFFIADEGTIFVDDDYESAEPRTFAHISGQDSIKQIFANGDDFYSAMCILVEGCTEYSANKKASNYLGKLNKLKRQQAKAYALGIVYHMTGYKLQFELGIPLEQAESLVKKYLNSFPNLQKWMAETDKFVLEHGYIRCEGGRIRRLPRASEIYKKYGKIILHDLELWKSLNESPGLYEAAKRDRRELKNLLANGANVQIQGRVASMINRAAIKIAREFKLSSTQLNLVGQLHDQLIVQCPIGVKSLAGEIVQRNMEFAMPHSVPMAAVPSFGYNLRDSKC